MIRLRASGMSGSLCQKRGLQDTYDLSMSLPMIRLRASGMSGSLCQKRGLQDTYDLSMSLLVHVFTFAAMTSPPQSGE
jgi:hypothetical protein